MSTCNQFTAPNGEPSLLYAGLLQKYGEDKALQIWSYVQSPAFKPADKSVDANGDPTLKSVEESMNSLNPSKFTNHSGGADGADREWDQIGREKGFVNHKHYREPGQTTVDSSTLRTQGIKAVTLDDVTYAEGRKMADRIDKILGENPNRGFGHYRYRNYGQVKNADAVFAISSGLGTREKAMGKPFMPLDRGTIYAIVGAVLDNKPVYVFDQKAKKWYTYSKDTKKFEVYNDTPILTPNYAGIGTRNITEAGKKAIADVYDKTLSDGMNQSVTKEVSTKLTPNEIAEADKLTPIEQNFRDGQGDRKMQPQFAGKSTMDLIRSGDRTRTTRANTDIKRMLKDYGLTKIEDLVGKVIRMTDKQGNTAYTRITKVAFLTQEYQDVTWQKEGWAKNVTDKLVGKYPYAIEFELANKGENNQVATQKTTTNQESTAENVIPRERFKSGSLVALNKTVETIYSEARNNPTVTYSIPLTPADVIYFGNKEKVTGAQLANVLDKENIPHNVTFDNSMTALMQNMPKNFIKGLVMEENNPLQLDEAAVEKQMKLMFAQVRNADGTPSGKYFDLDIQNQTLDSIIFQFYNIYSQLAEDPNKNEKLAGKSTMQYMREQVLGKFEGLRQAWTEVNNGNSTKRKPSTQSQSMVDNLNNIVSSFYVKGDNNHLWAFALERLNSYGIKMNRNEIIDTAGKPDNAIIEDENGDLIIEDGAITKDRGDSSFEMDLKDTASTRLKLWLLATPESKFIDEPAPENVTGDIDLFIGKEETRGLLQRGLKRDLILSSANAAKLKMTPQSAIAQNVVSTERDRLSQKTVIINGKPLRLTASRTITADDLANESLMSRIENEEGRKPQLGDVVLNVDPYTPKKDMLAPELNYLGVNKLANFESLFQDLSALLANREPSIDGYMQAMKSSGNANIQRVAQRLEQAVANGQDHIAKEFASVMSASYQRMLMVLMTRSKDGYLEPTVIDSNRASEVQTLQKFWQEAQKNSSILSRNEAGQTIVDKKIATELWDELQSIYNSAPKRSFLATEENRVKYKDKFKSLVDADQKRFEQDEIDYKQRKINLFKKVLEVNGITMDDKAIADLFPDNKESAVSKLGKGTQLKTMFGGFTQEGKPTGLVDTLIWRMTHAAEEDEGELETGEDFEPYKANNPLYVENTAMKILAKAQLKYTPQIYSQTHKSAEGKTIYSYGLNSAISHAVRKFKESKEYRELFSENNFSKNSWLLETLGGQEWILDKFQLTYLDGLKNRYGSRDGVTRPDMSDREQWLTILGLFQNGGAEKSLAHMVSLTHSDKTKTPVYMNAPRLTGTMTRKNGQLFIADHVIDKVYKSVFLSEHERMIQPGGEEIRGYKEGKKLFYLLPAFNYKQMAAMEKEGTITAGELKAIWADENTINNQDNVLFESTAKKLIKRQLNQMVRDTMESWESSKLTEDALPGQERYYKRMMEKVGLSKQGKEWFDGDSQLDEEAKKKIAIQLAAADYTINSFLFNTGLSQLFYGDPALTFKKDVATTMIEYGKRLAKDIAPGRDGEWSHSNTYTTITSADYEPLVKELSSLPAYQKSPANATDAQEVTTMKEHLNVMYAYGRITKSQLAAAQGIIAKANGGYYKFPAELESIILQPMKPVATGMQAPMNGVMKYDYVKSSSFALYPPVTAGLELDKLRKAMETGNVDRMNFISAKKIGAPVKIVELFDKEGRINDDVFKSAEWTNDSRQSMDRSQFRIQQDNPYDEDKDSILTVSQMNKNITEKIPTIQTAFNYKGEQKTGAELRQIKEDIRKQLISNSHGKFLEKVGAEYDAEKDVVKFKDKKKFYKLLAQEAKNRDGYTVNDLLALNSILDNTDELVVPLAFTPSANKFEGLMMSMVKKVVQIKMPGHSFIQASPAGFQTMKTWEESDLDRSSIVWTKPFDGELKTAHKDENGNIQPAQILVSFNYFSSKGNRINIQDYIKEKNGKKMLDTERMPPELFQLIGARIPNQGHSSMLPIEIVGFLPQNMGDMVVVPAGITKQMGADFDVDKLYTYHRAYKAEGNSLKAISDESDDSLKNDYFDVHWSVLTNPEMLDSMMNPLDKNDLKDLAEELTPTVKDVPYYYSPAYQMKDFQSMKGAKVLVGQTSLALTSNAVVQTAGVKLVSWDINDESEKEEKFVVTSSIKVADENGNPLELSHVSGFGETTYKGERRTKSDNIQIQQSESVDHAKNRIIDKINLDPNTSAASLAMSRLQTPDEGKPGEDGFKPGKAINLEYNALLLMQPIIQEYSAALSTANDTLSLNFESNVKDRVFEQLESKYTRQAMEAYIANGGEVGSDFDIRQVLDSSFVEVTSDGDVWIKANPQSLRETLKMSPKDPFYHYRQFQILQLFKEFDNIGSQLVTMQSTMAQDTRGAGKDLLSALNIMDKKAKPNIASEKFVAGVAALFGNEEQKTLTEVGQTYKATVDTAVQLYSTELPYAKLQKTYNSVMEQAGKDGLTDDQKKLVFDAMKSFAFNSKKLGLFTNAYTERTRLLFSADGRMSLAKRVNEAKSTWGKNNYFLQRLGTNIDPDGIKPDMIEYNAAKASMADDVENSKAWLTMMNSEDAAKKELAFDLLRYSYLTGGLQGARNFVKFTPWAAIEGSQIAFGLREQFENIHEFNDNNALVEQIFQHNPQMARQLSADLKEIGQVEELPDTFMLPVFNADDRKSNPASSLAVTVTGEDGKKYEDYPNYISYRKDNKFVLFKRMGLLSDRRPMYARIDTLGDSKLQLTEYAASAGEVDQKGLRSVVTENRAPWFENISPEHYLISNNFLDSLRTSTAISASLRQVGIVKQTGNYEDMQNSLRVIGADYAQPLHLRSIANLLVEMQRNAAEEHAYSNIFGFDRNFTYRVEGEPDTLTIATFNSGLNVMTFYQPKFANKELIAETIIHENIHYHTAILMAAMEGPEGWARRKMSPGGIQKMIETLEFINANPELKDKIDAIDSVRQQAYDKLKVKMGNELFEQAKQDVAKGIISSPYHRLMYALGTSTEFVSHVLSDKTLINFLNNIPFDEKKSFLEHIKELFSKVWESFASALGVQRGTLAEESVKRTLDLLTHNQIDTINTQSLSLSDHNLYGDLTNASIGTKELSAVDKVIGKLEEQKQELISSFTGVIDRKARLDKRHKIEEIEDDISRLKESQDLMLVSEIGKKHLDWVARVHSKVDPNENEIMTAIRTGNMWRGIVDLMFGDDATSVDPELAKLASQSGNLVHSLISKSKEYMIDASKGVIKGNKDFDQVQDISKDQALLRSLSSAAKSNVVSHIANFIETTARQRDEDCYRLMRELNKLEKEMLTHAGSKKGLEQLYNSMTETGAKTLGLTLQYSQNWFDWRKTIISKRNAHLAKIEETFKGDKIGSLGPKRAAWKAFWDEVDEKATFVDTRAFFDAETGEFKKDIEELKKKLAEQVGQDHVETLLARAQERYLSYVEDRSTYFETLDAQVVLGERTAEDADILKKEWQNKNSPNVFFDRTNNARSFSAATERYVAMAPKLSSKAMWNDNYKKIMDDEKTKDFYSRYKMIMDELLSYLPKTIQDRAGADFLPVVRKEVMSDMLGVKDWVKTFNERFVKSVAASAWEEQMNDKAYNKIPIDYVNASTAEVEDRSKDLIGMARIFGMMAMHYKHFSAAKDYIDMGETILKEIERARTEGVSQMEQNGKVVTVKKGLRNSLDALQYLKEYAMYRKPKLLEASSGAKLYAKTEGINQKFSLNPIKQIQMTRDVKRLTKEREAIEQKFMDGSITEEEYEKAIDPINKELGKYEGFKLFGSKVGDKLIGINQLKALSYNPFSAVANVTFGMISINIHAAGGRDFNPAEVSAANKLMWKAKFDKNLSAKIMNVMDRLGVIGDYIDSKYGQHPDFRDNKSAWKKAADPFAMMRSSDFHMKGVTTLAVLLHIKTEVNGQQMSIWDTLNEEGNWNEIEHGVRPEWYSQDVKEQTEWDKLRNRIIRVNVILHGNQDKNAPKMLNKTILGRLLGQFRASWLPEGWYARFQDERYDENLGRTVKGRYRSFFDIDNQVGVGGYAMILGKQLLGLIPGVKIDPFNNITTIGGKLLTDMDSTDMENMRRNFSEMGYFLMLAGAVAMLKYLQDDDDKDPYLQVLINMLIRSKQDIDFYASPGVFDAVFRDPIPASNVIKDYYKAVGATMRVITDDDYTFEQWVLKMTKAGIPIPQATLINKTKYMIQKDLDALQ